MADVRGVSNAMGCKYSHKVSNALNVMNKQTVICEHTGFPETLQ
jgi:hypothetical protein